MITWQRAKGSLIVGFFSRCPIFMHWGIYLSFEDLTPPCSLLDWTNMIDILLSTLDGAVRATQKSCKSVLSTLLLSHYDTVINFYQFTTIACYFPKKTCPHASDIWRYLEKLSPVLEKFSNVPTFKK